MARPADHFTTQRSVRRPWRRYVDQLEPHRASLHQYCCRLKGNVRDGEDLVQDTLVRVFSQLGKTDISLGNPKAYLNEVHRLEVTDGRISRVRLYCFCLETLAVVAGALGVKALPRPHRSPSTGDVLGAMVRRPAWRRRLK